MIFAAPHEGYLDRHEAAPSLGSQIDFRGITAGCGPRKHGPTRDGPGSPALYATQRVLSIPFRLVIETAHTIIEHLIAPEQVTSPGAITLAPRR